MTFQWIWPGATVALLLMTLLPLSQLMARWIIPYTRLWPVEVLDANGAKPCLRLMTANVLTPNRGTPRFVSMVREHSADILITLESDARWQQDLATLDDDYPHSRKVPLDHFFHSEHFTDSELRRLPDFGSDHFPLLVALCFQPQRGVDQKALEKDGDDRALEREKAAAEPVAAADVPTPGSNSTRKGDRP